jgi:hypothetical protein
MPNFNDITRRQTELFLKQISSILMYRIVNTRISYSAVRYTEFSGSGKEPGEVQVICGGVIYIVSTTCTV